MTRPKKTQLSFNDLSFRIPGLIVSLLGIVLEFLTLRNGGNSNVQITESIQFPGHLALSLLGLLMFMSPYVIMAYDIHKSNK